MAGISALVSYPVEIPQRIKILPQRVSGAPLAVDHVTVSGKASGVLFHSLPCYVEQVFTAAVFNNPSREIAMGP